MNDYLHLPLSFFAYPLNGILLGGYGLLLWLLSLGRRKNALYRFLMRRATILGLLALLMLSLIPQALWAVDVVHSWFFLLLLMVLMAQLFWAVLLQLRRGVGLRLDFCLLHLGLLLVLLSMSFGAPDFRDMRLLLRPSESQARAVDREGHLYVLPFSLQLISSEVVYTPPPKQVKMYRAELDITHEEGQVERAALEVNRPGKIGRYRLYLENFDQNNEQTRAIQLRITYDPWLYATYVGIYMLLAGISLMVLRKINIHALG